MRPAQLGHTLPAWLRRLLVAALAVVLFTVSPTTVNAPTADAATSLSYAMIGDSITWQATAHLEEYFGEGRVHGEIGRSFAQADLSLADMLAGGTPDVLVVAFGTNPTMTLAQVDAFMPKTAGIDQVFFVNVRIPRDWETPTNALINSLPDRYANVSVIDWYGFTAIHPEVINDTGFHLTDDGKPIYADFISSTVFAETEECVPPTQTVPGSAGVGVVDGSRGFWYLRDPLTGKTTSFYYGNPGDTPFMGDWNGDGVDTPGLYRRTDGYAYLRNSNTQGVADRRFFFGNPGDVPVPGDFDFDGFDTLSLYRPSNQTFYVINELGSDEGGLGVAEYEIVFGNPGDQPIAGDFDGNEIIAGKWAGLHPGDTVGIYRPSSGLVSWAGAPMYGISYGATGDVAVMGAYEGGAGDAIGVFRPTNAQFYLRSSYAPGAADHVFRYGKSGYLPVAGVFGDLPGISEPPTPSFCD